jgi:hypothetical protein
MKTPGLWLALILALQAGKEPKPPQDVPPIGKGKLLLYEDFETTAPGDIPKGYQKQGAVGVVNGVGHSGRRSLRVEAAANGPRRITVKGDVVTAIGGQHWGRLFYRVQLPTPMPANGVIHSTLVAASGKSPLHKDGIEVRFLDTIQGTTGDYGFIYNVQPSGGRPEFGKGGGRGQKFTDQWTLAEWYVDYATQTYRLFINGEEIKDIAFMKGPGQFKDAEIPEVLESLSFGWYNYQQAGAGFVAWIDDIAIAKDRLGTRNIPPPAKASKKP